MILLVLNLFYLLLTETWVRRYDRLGQLLPHKLSAGDYPKVSVVLAVRNEAPVIERIVADLIAQQYPGPVPEIIVIDDHSDDETAAKALAFAPAIRILRLEKGEGQGKKAALSKGIRHASGDWILTTDADCRLSPGWVRTMVEEGENHHADMVCGSVKVQQEAAFMHQFQAMESAALQVSAAASLSQGQPLLNNGASLAFRREAWEAVSGYGRYMGIASGDDTFLMLAMHRRRPGRVIPCIRQDATVLTGTQATWKNLLQQRLRWQGKLRHYPPGYIILLGAFQWLSAIVLPLAFIGCFFITDWIIPLATAWLLRLWSEQRLLVAWRKQTGQKFSISESVAMTFFYPVFLLYLPLAALFIKPAWKGRRV